MIRIGIAHKARQGKNLVAEYLKDLARDSDAVARIYGFADELKLYCRDHHDELLPQWQLAHQTKQIPACKDDPIYGYTRILQWYGTEVARKRNPEIWVTTLAERIKKENPDVAIVADVRYPNEAEYIKQNGGHLIKVIRRMKDGSLYQDPTRDPNHLSEIALDNYEGWDFEIDVKDGDLRDLKRKATGVWNIITGDFNDLEEDHSLVLPSLNSDATGFNDDEGPYAWG